jgi:hypothetical protein
MIPTEPGRYDAEWIVVLDDWTDGIGKTPEEIYGDLHAAPTSPTCDALSPLGKLINFVSTSATGRPAQRIPDGI